MTGAGARLCCVFTSFTASGVRKGGVFGRRFIISQHRNMAGGAPKIDFNTKHLKKDGRTSDFFPSEAQSHKIPERQWQLSTVIPPVPETPQFDRAVRTAGCVLRDPLPPFAGKLRVYNMRYCPYAQRTVLALNAKRVDYEVVNVNLVDKPEWLTTKSAFAKVPALEIADGVTIYESLVTVNYIDDVYPQRPLRARDPLRRAQDQILIEAIGPLENVLIKMVRAPETIDEAALKAYFKGWDLLQEELKKRGTSFFSGNEPGYVDYMIWPWIERLLAFQKKDERIKFDTPKYKLLGEYIQKMAKDPAISQYAVPDEVLLKFFEGFISGNIVYEL
ncbi:Pyrimidodiazepine synthase [Eumeta japonica]|uniref:Pyrimidodiazepine synthase n=1 Tax=Eumeta variegata TaxID=151549 RepID=A0A4C1XPZ8_EUMVA|nr:Pyrimidodiazepine synthase [Eumeta japonica]